MARMKVLLTQDVPNLGEAGGVFRVASGYARNFLMPRGMAVTATASALKQAEDLRLAGLRRRAREKSNAEAQSQMIQSKRLLFKANAGENDRLYGSVTTAEIATKLSSELGFEVDRRKIQLEHPIRELGIFPVEMRLMQDVVSTFIVGVVREGEDWPAAEARAAAKAAAAAANA